MKSTRCPFQQDMKDYPRSSMLPPSMPTVLLQGRTKACVKVEAASEEEMAMKRTRRECLSLSSKAPESILSVTLHVTAQTVDITNVLYTHTHISTLGNIWRYIKRLKEINLSMIKGSLLRPFVAFSDKLSCYQFILRDYGVCRSININFLTFAFMVIISHNTMITPTCSI